MSSENKVFKYLDEPMRIAFFTLDEAFLVFGGLFATIVSTKALCLFVGLVSCYILRKYKKKIGNDLLKRLHYWYLPQSRALRIIPPSYIREYLG